MCDAIKAPEGASAEEMQAKGYAHISTRYAVEGNPDLWVEDFGHAPLTKEDFLLLVAGRHISSAQAAEYLGELEECKGASERLAAWDRLETEGQERLNSLLRKLDFQTCRVRPIVERLKEELKAWDGQAGGGSDWVEHQNKIIAALVEALGLAHWRSREEEAQAELLQLEAKKHTVGWG